MADDTPKTTSKTKTSGPQESTAEAPGPISPEHESGSFEQTAKVAEAREALRQAQQTTAKS